MLECAVRGGRAVLPTVERYRPALREAEWWLDETWEPDVPHAAVVGQALSAANALEVDPPSNWPDLLGEAITALERRRQGRFGIEVTRPCWQLCCAGATAAGIIAATVS